MSKMHKIRLFDNKAITVTSDLERFDFVLDQQGGELALVIPGSRWEGDFKRKMSEDEMARILPLVLGYLRPNWLFRVLGLGKKVKVVEAEYDARFDDPTHRHTPPELRRLDRGQQRS